MMINYQATVKEAMERGKWPVKYMPLILFMGGIFGGIFGFIATDNPVCFYILGAGILGSILLGLRNSVEWKHWALDNVRDIHRLYQVAEREQYITDPDGWWNRTLLGMTAKGREVRQMEIRRLIDEPRLYESATGRPQDIEFGYSNSTFYVGIPIVLLIVVGLLTNFVQFNSFGIIIAVIGAGVMLYSMFNLWQKMSANSFMIRLDSNGITIEDNPLIMWSDVINSYTERRGSGRHSRFYFIVVKQDGEMEEIDIGEMQGSPSSLDDAAAEFLAWSKQGSRQGHF